MQIKRFKAADMTAALNLVKQTFGPDAVILSARSIQRESGLFGWMRRPGVEVTAAIDPHNKPAAPTAEARPAPPAPMAAHNAVASGAGLRRAYGSPPLVCQSYQRNGLVRLQQDALPPTPTNAIAEMRRILAGHGVNEALIQDLIDLLPVPEAASRSTLRQTLTAALAEAIEAKGIAMPNAPLPRVIALVGPTGVGKTTAAARLAAQRISALEGRIGLISCDDRKIGADAEIQRYARILDIPLAYAWNPEAMADAMADMQDRELVIIDTPGVSPCHRNGLAVLKEMLTIAGAQSHLLLSAAAKAGDLEKTLDRFSELDIERLAFTRLDETESHGILLNLPVSRRIPLSWITFGPQIPEALRRATADALARLLIDPLETMEQWRGRSVWVVAEKTNVAPETGPQPKPAANTDENVVAAYIASRHSDTFHRPDCKWARTIKPGNRISFSSRADAESRHLHACPNCCPATVCSVADDSEKTCHPSPSTGNPSA